MNLDRITQFLLRRWDEIGDGLEYGLYAVDRYVVTPIEAAWHILTDDPLSLVQALLILGLVLVLIYV